MTPKQRVAAWVAAGILGAAGAFLGTWEGNERKAYRDIVGVVTACRGVTGPGIELGRTYTAAECAAMNDAALLDHLEGMARCVRVELTQGEAVAYLSLAYNVGAPTFCGSTLVRKLNAGDRAGACRELLRWVNAGGRPVRGLINRRQAEYRICIGSNS